MFFINIILFCLCVSFFFVDCFVAQELLELENCLGTIGKYRFWILVGARQGGSHVSVFLLLLTKQQKQKNIVELLFGLFFSQEIWELEKGLRTINKYWFWILVGAWQRGGSTWLFFLFLFVCFLFIHCNIIIIYSNYYYYYYYYTNAHFTLQILIFHYTNAHSTLQISILPCTNAHLTLQISILVGTNAHFILQILILAYTNAHLTLQISILVYTKAHLILKMSILHYTNDNSLWKGQY